MSDGLGTMKSNKIVPSDVGSERSTAALLGGSKEIVASKAKALWEQLKAENEAKKRNIQHVTSKEATVITGYGENGVNFNIKDGKGDKRTAAAFAFF